jgi:hypothetical protein
VIIKIYTLVQEYEGFNAQIWVWFETLYGQTVNQFNLKSSFSSFKPDEFQTD